MHTRIFVGLVVIGLRLSCVGQVEPGKQVQLKGYVIGGADVLDNLGYTNPLLSLGGGLEMTSPQMFVTSQFTFSLSHKVETQDGHSRNAEMASYKKFGSFLLGAGTKYSQLTTSQWEKSSWRPFFGAGYEGESFRLQARYVVPAFDEQNRLGGALIVFDYRASRHFGTEMRWGVYRFKDTRVPGVFYAQPAEKHTGAETGLALKYFF
jgi:hypothetical protein